MTTKQIEESELQPLLEVIEEQNISIAEAVKRIEDGNGQAKEQPKTIVKILNLSVNYDRDLREMLEAGKYDSVNDCEINTHFPLPVELKGEVITIVGGLFCFRKEISSEYAISEMDKAGYRPATLPELLALGEAQPELQYKFSIIALGSVWYHTDGNPILPGLSHYWESRQFDLHLHEGDWFARCCFLGVRKEI